jgi:hypothetical protein
MARIGESEQHDKIYTTLLRLGAGRGDVHVCYAIRRGRVRGQAKKETTRGQLLLSPDGNVGLALNDAAERPHIRFEVSAEGKTTIDILGADKQN